MTSLHASDGLSPTLRRVIVFFLGFDFLNGLGGIALLGTVRIG
jgi:hypothetical protein